jgi:uncharacterized protein YkwD
VQGEINIKIVNIKHDLIMFKTDNRKDTLQYPSSKFVCIEISASGTSTFSKNISTLIFFIMRCLIPFLLVSLSGLLTKATSAQDYYDDPTPNVEYPEWKDPKYLAANSAQDEDYLTAEEKKVYFYLNLARMDPGLFANTFLAHLEKSTDYYESSLVRELKCLKPLPVLKPNRLLYESAHCHAADSGERGYTGHERSGCKGYFMGECCHYGNSDALDIVIKLLIDRNVSSLGHRRVCFGDYTFLGVSIQPHIIYGKNAVLDFE